MKKTLFTLLCMSYLSVGFAQLKPKVKCPDVYVDVLNGTVNGDIKASTTLGEIKIALPCFSSFEDEGGAAKCGGGVYYKDKDIYFYTKRDYIEIGPKFQGKLSLPLLASKRGSLFKTLGNPKMKDDKWDAYETSYGILVLHYDATGKVHHFQISTQGAETLSLCE